MRDSGVQPQRVVLRSWTGQQRFHQKQADVLVLTMHMDAEYVRVLWLLKPKAAQRLGPGFTQDNICKGSPGAKTQVCGAVSPHGSESLRVLTSSSSEPTPTPWLSHLPPPPAPPAPPWQQLHRPPLRPHPSVSLSLPSQDPCGYMGSSWIIPGTLPLLSSANQ